MKKIIINIIFTIFSFLFVIFLKSFIFSFNSFILLINNLFLFFSSFNFSFILSSVLSISFLGVSPFTIFWFIFQFSLLYESLIFNSEIFFSSKFSLFLLLTSNSNDFIFWFLFPNSSNRSSISSLSSSYS